MHTPTVQLFHAEKQQQHLSLSLSCHDDANKMKQKSTVCIVLCFIPSVRCAVCSSKLHCVCIGVCNLPPPSSLSLLYAKICTVQFNDDDDDGKKNMLLSTLEREYDLIAKRERQINNDHTAQFYMNVNRMCNAQ